MKQVYVLLANYDWTSAKFFSSKEKAVASLEQKRKEIKVRGVQILKDTDTEFEFLLGWEEHHVLWKIVERPVE